MASSATIEARRAARSPWVGWLGRAGLAAKGLSYLLVAALAVNVALDGRGRPADRPGALRQVSGEPFGELALLALAAGLAAYALWRFAQGFLDRGDEGEDIGGLAKRAGYVARGALYGGLSLSALSVVAGRGEGGGNEDRATAGVLDAPGGRYLVIAAGIGIAGAGAWNLYRALAAKFREQLRTCAASDAPETLATALGVAGHLARGIVFGIAAWFLIRAALEYDPKQAVGLDGALAKLAQQPYGPWLLGAVAAGLGCYGLYSLFEARYRRV